MKLLFFYSQETPQTKRLENLIESFVASDVLEVFKSMETIIERFKSPLDDVTTAVFVASSLAELKEFYKLRNYFFDLRHIIILPEKDKKMIAVAHKLRPRFLSYSENDFNVVSAVLKKMFANHRPVNIPMLDTMNFESAG